MRTFIVYLSWCIFLIAANDNVSIQETAIRIVGGSLTTIDQYPFAVAFSRTTGDGIFSHNCGGAILTTTAILSAAHCFSFIVVDPVHIWRARVGSSFASSGGNVHLLSQFIIHPLYSASIIINDVAVARTSSPITYIPNTVAAGAIAGTNYIVPDSQVTIGIGWGLTSFGGQLSEQLKHVQVLSVNQDVCRDIMRGVGFNITDDMLCTGLDSEAGTCTADSGGPVIHSGVVVGITSFGLGCGIIDYPDINARVSSYTNWIVAAAA